MIQIRETCIAIILAFLMVATAFSGSWLDEYMVNTVSAGKQASRGTDTPWSMVADNNGRIHVVWEDRRAGQNLSIYYRGKSPSPGWDNWDIQDINISPIDSTQLIGHPSVGALDNGSLISVFAEEKNFGGELLGTILPSGLSCWGQPEFISIPGGNCLSFNSTGWQTTIATNGHRAVTFWPYIGEQLDNYRPIFFRRFQDGNWEPEEIPIALPDIGLHYFAKNLSAVWARQDTIYLVFAGMPENPALYNIYFIKLNFANNALLDFQLLASDSLISQEFPYICRQTDNNGIENIYIVYESHGSEDIAKMIYKMETSAQWSSPIRLGDTQLSSAYPCIAVNPMGAIELAFEQPGNEPSSQIYHQTFYPGADTLSISERISGGDHFSKRPVIACDRFGNVHVVYITDRLYPLDPGNEEVFYRMLDAPPLAPRNVVISEDTLQWDYGDLPDLRYFQIFAIDDFDTSLIGGTVNHFFRHSMGGNARLGVRVVDLAYQSSPLVIADIRNDINDHSDSYPGDFQIGPNYPNPFNSVTIIPVVGKRVDKDTRAIIYDLLGQIIRQIIIRPTDKSIVWDGTDQNSRPVSSGVYFYRLDGITANAQAGKMILLR